MQVNYRRLVLLLLLVILTYFSPQVIASTTNVDSLEAILSSTAGDIEKFNATNELAEQNLRYNVNRSIDILMHNLSAPQLSQFPAIEAKSFYLKGRAHLLISDLKTAQFFLEKAKKFFLQNNQFKDLGDTYKDLGTLELRQNNYSKAEKYYQLGIIAYEEGNYDAGFAHCNLNLGNVRTEQFLYTEGIQYYYNALEKYEQLKMNRYVGMCHNNIGNIYNDIQHYEKAYEHYQQALASYRVDQDSIEIVKVNLNIGATYLDQGNYEQALTVLYQAQKDATSVGYNYLLPMIHNNIAACYIKLKDYEKSKHESELAYQIARLNNNAIETINAQLMKAEITLRQKKYPQAIALADQVYAEAAAKKQINLMTDASEILYAAHRALNHYEESLQYLEIHKKHQDSLVNENNIKIPLSKDFKYQLEKQKREQVFQQKKDKLEWENQLAFQRFITNVLVIGFLLVGAASFMMYRNYSAKKRAEAELAKKNTMLEKYIESNIQLEQFAHIASHDLKSPLRTVGSFSSLLKRRAGDKLNENELEYLDMISNAAKLMWNLVDDLMTYSQANSLQMNLTSSDVNRMLQDILVNLDFAIREKNAEIKIAQMPMQIMVDDTKLRQVFQNLIANSLKFTTSEIAPVIHVDGVKQGDFWKFSVKDNGIGIPAEYRDKIFMPYKQLHTKDKFEGTGMGLAICKKIVEKHGGEISCESEVGKGTTFFFTIPVSTEHSQKVALMSEPMR
ncbi:MAG: ATP-binding protein [Bacteroidota bacterium]